METKKLKAPKLAELLIMLDGVRTSNYQIMRALQKVIGDCKVISKEWGDSHKNKYPDFHPLNLEKFDNWCTFDNRECVSLNFFIENALLHCDVMIHEGDSFRGHRKNMRFKALIVLPSLFINNIEDVISYNFDLFLEEKYEQHLLVQKLMFIANLKMKYLEI